MCNCGCNTCETKIRGPLLTEGRVKKLVSENLQYHINENIPLMESVFRIGSDAHLSLIKEARKLYSRGVLDLCEEDQGIMETHLGEFDLYEDEIVPLDLPMINEGIDYDEALTLRGMLADLNDERDQLFRDMENDPSVEPEGGPIADEYGSRLNKIEDRIYKISKQLRDYDMNEGEDLDPKGRLVKGFNPGEKYFLPDDGYMSAKLRAEDDWYTPWEGTNVHGDTTAEEAEWVIKNQMGIKDPEKIKKFVTGWEKYTRDVLDGKIKLVQNRYNAPDWDDPDSNYNVKENVSDQNFVKGIEIIKQTLSDEGGAAGLEPLVKALIKLGFNKYQVKDLLSKMTTVKQHRDGDYVLLPLEEDKKEELLTQIRNALLDMMRGDSEREKDIEDLDVSIDAMNAALTGRSTFDTDVSQKVFGRLADPKKKDKLKEAVRNALTEKKKKKKKEKKDPPIGKPKRGGSKAYYVYVRDPKTKKVKKVSFGSGGLRAKIRNPKARKAFAARHKCSQKTDRTKPSYWSCRLPRYASQLGLGANMNTFW